MQVSEFNEVPNNPFLDHPVIAIINLDKQFRIKVSTADNLNNGKIPGSLYCVAGYHPNGGYLWKDGTLHTSMLDHEKSEFPGWFAFLSDVFDALELYEKNRHDSLQTK